MFVLTFGDVIAQKKSSKIHHYRYRIGGENQCVTLNLQRLVCTVAASQEKEHKATKGHRKGSGIAANP